MSDYQQLLIYKRFNFQGTSWSSMVSDFTNQLHAYFHLW
jgi:hypothetical protein